MCLLLKINLLFALAWLTSCDKSKPVSQRDQTGNATGNLYNPYGTTGSDENDPYGFDDSRDYKPPEHQRGNVDEQLGQGPKRKMVMVPEEDLGKRFLLVQRTDAYRPVWLDLRKNTDEMNFWKDFAGQDVPHLGKVFKRPEAPDVEQLSIHQPLPASAEINIERGDQYRVLGHAVTGRIGPPPIPTAMASLYAGQDPQALRAPDGYDLVYYKEGSVTQDYFEACQKYYATFETQEEPDPTDQDKCESIQMGTTKVYDLMNAKWGTAPDLQSFIEKQTVAVWKPIAPRGYGCLGFISTNTTSAPYSIGDAAGGESSARYGAEQTGKLAMYCVHKKYLTEGKLELYTGSKDGSVTFFKIKAVDPSVGYNKGNFFYALSEEGDEKIEDVQVYVLKKDVIRVLDDVRLTDTAP